MPEISTIFRDYGNVPTIIAIGFIALIIYSIMKGGKNSKGGNGTGSGSSNSAPPSSPPPASTN